MNLKYLELADKANSFDLSADSKILFLEFPLLLSRDAPYLPFVTTDYLISSLFLRFFCLSYRKVFQKQVQSIRIRINKINKSSKMEGKKGTGIFYLFCSSVTGKIFLLLRNGG